MSAYTQHAGPQPDPFNPEALGGTRFRLTRELIWRIGMETGPSYTVPAGFEFDVSVPRWLWWIFNPREQAYLKGAALHDHMLIHGWSRLTAAAEFHNALKADGVRLWRRLAMFLATALWRYE
jgi:hypothetical protein